VIQILITFQIVMSLYLLMQEIIILALLQAQELFIAGDIMNMDS
jgi:hypothetical protein